MSAAFKAGLFENCQWFYHFGGSPALWTEYVTTVESMYPSLPPGCLSLTVVYRMPPPNAAQRKAFTEMMERLGGGARLGYHAFLTDSAILTGVNTAMSWIWRKPFQEETFMSPASALASLERRGLDVEGLVRTIRAEVPTEARWPALLEVSPSKAR